MEEKLKWLKFKNPNLLYQFYYARNGKHDKSNFSSVISKYFLDSLVNYWCIEDDSDEFVGFEASAYWWIDKENPRCDIYINWLLQ